MCEKFIQFVRSEINTECLFLLSNFPNAFLLLSLIAQRARFYPDHPDGLQPGECFIDWESCGLTRQKYRTAIKILIMRKHINIISTSRNRKKSTTEPTTVSTRVCLISSNVYDLNISSDNHSINQRPTTDQPQTKNDKNEKKKDKKKINKEKTGPEKIAFREFVFLTQAEFDSASTWYDKKFLDLMLDELDRYKGANDKKYASDFHVLKKGGWLQKKIQKEFEQETQQGFKKPSQVDRRTKNVDDTPVKSPADGRF